MVAPRAAEEKGGGKVTKYDSFLRLREHSAHCTVAKISKGGRREKLNGRITRVPTGMVRKTRKKLHQDRAIPSRTEEKAFKKSFPTKRRRRISTLLRA